MLVKELMTREGLVDNDPRGSYVFMVLMSSAPEHVAINSNVQDRHTVRAILDIMSYKLGGGDPEVMIRRDRGEAPD